MKSNLQYLHHTIRERHSYIDFHKHPMFEIVYYCSGTGYTTINNKKEHYAPGTFAVIFPDSLHDEYREDDTDVIYFGFYYDNEVARIAPGLYTDAEGKLQTLLNMMLKETSQQGTLYPLMLDSLLYCLLIEAHRICGNPVEKEIEERLNHAIRYMEQYFSQKINLTELASISGYSYDHFRHMFKNYTGVTPMNMVLQLRIEKAKDMLANNQYNLTDIAYACGFSSLAHFSNLFKKSTGQSPRAYKKQAVYEKAKTHFTTFKDDPLDQPPAT